MPDIQYTPLTHIDESAMLPLMKEEARIWLTDLGWDYSVTQQVLLSFIREKMLPGYAALTDGKQPAGYVYFLTNRAKGSIGSIYATPTTPPDTAQKMADGLVELAIACLQDSSEIRRIESQIFPFHGQDYAWIFNKYGFRRYPRLYLVMNIGNDVAGTGIDAPLKIIPWDSALIGNAAVIAADAYLNHPDHMIFEDYHTPSNCENYLNGLVSNPGCGVVLPDASFMCLDEHGTLCGYIICSRISDGRAMIPQIVTHPARQGRGISTALMNRCLRQLQAMNFHSLSIVVTKDNSRACEWYLRMGFQPRREFNAFIWNRYNSDCCASFPLFSFAR